MIFSEILIRWYEENGRSLPWRGIDDPYRIWLSEIILQQTRIEQGLSYYQHFITEYPTVGDLAKASEEQVLKSWQGLGYYSRARNLHAAAKQIVEQHHGVFPSQYEKILALKGVGRYTAAAIASFAFRLPYPVIDGNVYRAAARLFDISTPINSNSAYNEFEALLLRIIDRSRPDLFNQAMMDFGSLCCRPVNPACDECPFRERCLAFERGKVMLLPVKAPATKIKNRYFYYFDIQWHTGESGHSQICRLMHQRMGDDIWKGLYEFPLLETSEPIEDKNFEAIANRFLASYCDTSLARIVPAGAYKHQLTHRTIHAHFYRVDAATVTLNGAGNDRPIALEATKTLPVSRLIDRYLLAK